MPEIMQDLIEQQSSITDASTKNLGRKSQKIKKNGFMTLCYGILTLETSDCFLLPEHFEKSSGGGFEMKFPFYEAEWNVCTTE